MSKMSLLDISDSDLARFSDKEAVVLFRDLIWAECSKLGISPNEVDITDRTTVPDGGIDAEVRTTAKLSGMFKTPLTSFQIKTGTSFKPWRKNVVERELLGAGKKKGAKRELDKGVKDCLERDGTYVVVCFGENPTPPQRRTAEAAFRKVFKANGFRHAKVEVWGQSHIVGFMKAFPPLLMRVRRISEQAFRTWTQWGRDAEMKGEYFPATDFDAAAESLRNMIRGSTDQQIRIRAGAGTGKTRFIFEALRSPDLAPLVIYTTAGELIPSPFYNLLTHDGESYRLVLIVDECSLQKATELHNRFSATRFPITIITIYNDEFEIPQDHFQYPTLPTLGNKEITSIIEAYGIQTREAERYATYVEGSPRFAHQLGNNLKLHPGSLIREQSGAFERVVAGYDDPKSPSVVRRRLVLQHIALFKRFGFSGPVSKEGKAISAIVSRADPLVTWPAFQDAVRELRKLRVLQGENTLYITPKLLHVAMWAEWWDRYGDGFELDGFMQSFPQNSQLQSWFLEMFKYARESQVALEAVNRLLTGNGPFKNLDSLRSKLGGHFFLALTDANPKAALDKLTTLFDNLTDQEIQSFENRRDVIWTIERTAVWKELFCQSARLLLRFAVSETEDFANNATGVFCELFSNGWGQLAPTEASPEERFPVLAESLAAASPIVQTIAIKACDAALESRHMTRMVGREHQGLKIAPKLWTPKTYGELHTAFLRVWNSLDAATQSMPPETRNQAARVLVKRATQHATMPQVQEMVLPTLRRIHDAKWLSVEEIVSSVNWILKHERLSKESREKWSAFAAYLEGSDFSGRLHRHVGVQLWEYATDKQGKSFDPTTAKLLELADEAVSNKELLIAELPWLLSNNAKRGWEFGNLVGQRDSDAELLSSCVSALRELDHSASSAFLGGYLRAVSVRDKPKWEETLRLIKNDATLSVRLPELVKQSQITDSLVKDILDLTHTNVVPITALDHLGYMNGFEDIKIETVSRTLEELTLRTDPIVGSIILDVIDAYFIRRTRRPLVPTDLIVRALTHQSFVIDRRQLPRRADEFQWNEVALKLLEESPTSYAPLMEFIVGHFGEDGTLFDDYWHHTKVIDYISKHHPDELWDRVCRHFEPPISGVGFHLSRWLRQKGIEEDNEGAFQFMKPSKVWSWIDEDIKNRAWYVATFVPKVLHRKEGRVCWAREILVRYGASKSVRDNLSANFHTEGWSGRASSHYRARVAQLRVFREQESNKNVQRWLDSEIESLTQSIAIEQVREEREEF
jgi:hypothetical protein